MADGNRYPHWEESEKKMHLKRRCFLLGLIAALVFVVLLVQLFWLQVRQEEFFLNRALTQSTGWTVEEEVSGDEW